MPFDGSFENTIGIGYVGKRSYVFLFCFDMAFAAFIKVYIITIFEIKPIKKIMYYITFVSSSLSHLTRISEMHPLSPDGEMVVNDFLFIQYFVACVAYFFLLIIICFYFNLPAFIYLCIVGF